MLSILCLLCVLRVNIFTERHEKNFNSGELFLKLTWLRPLLSNNVALHSHYFRGISEREVTCGAIDLRLPCSHLTT